MIRRWTQVPAIRAAVLVFALAGPIGWLLFFALFRRAPAQDLMVFHTAGRLALAHDWALLRDGQAFTALLNRSHANWLGTPLVLHPWVYPPPTLLLAAAIAPLPFGLAYALFMLASLAALKASLWRWWSGVPARPLWIGLVLLCPATAFCVGSGQLTFLIAAAFLSALMLLPSRQMLAGCLLGLLFLKPQFGLMVPVALLAGRSWWAIAGATATVLLLMLVSVLAFGLTPWRDWLHFILSGDPALAAWTETGRHFGQSVDTCVRLLGAPPSVASAAQLVAICLSAVCVWRAFSRWPAGFGGRVGFWWVAKAQPTLRTQMAVVLLCAAVLAAPHVGNYDAVLLGMAAVMTLVAGLEHPFRRWEVALAMAAWLSSLINPPALIGLIGLPPLTAASLATPLIIAALMVTALKPLR